VDLHLPPWYQSLCKQAIGLEDMYAYGFGGFSIGYSRRTGKLDLSASIDFDDEVSIEIRSDKAGTATGSFTGSITATSTGGTGIVCLWINEL
jgi:hypothetical protein